MNFLHRLNVFFAALWFSCAPALAQWQTPNHSVPVGRGGGAQGFNGAAPGTAGVPLTSTGATTDPTFSAVAAAGIQSNAVTNAKINPGAANTLKGSIDGATTSDLAIASCSALYQFTQWVSGTGWRCGINPVLPSRAIALTLNLSAFDAVTTQGYYKPGDGGGATFYKRSTAILTYSITSAGACNNGVWPGIRLTGGSGSGAYGTLTVAGGVATNFSLHGSGAQGNGYTVGDVLLVSSAGNVACSAFPTITVNSVGNGPFTDSSVTALSISTAGSGCTNATYYGLTPQETVTNGGGYGDALAVNATVSGGAVTAVAITNPGGGYLVGDRLNFVNPNTSAQIPGCGTQPILTVSTTATPRGSFTDNNGSGVNWQIVTSGFVNVLQFGAIRDYIWLMPDGDATDNGPAFRAAATYASSGNGPADAHGYSGGVVFVPKGGYLICGGVVQYAYVGLQGVGHGGTTLKQCNTDVTTASLITQGDPLSRQGNFEANTWDMTLYGSTQGTGPVIYSNNNQGGDTIQRLAIYPNSISGTCIKYEIGYGGQTMYGIHSTLCVPATGSPAFDLSGNFGFVIDGETQLSSSSTVAIGIRFGQGSTAFVGSGVHGEGTITNFISVNGSGSSPPQVTVMGSIGNPSVTNTVRIETGTPANYVTMINTSANGTTCAVFMQATATCAKSGNQLGVGTY